MERQTKRMCADCGALWHAPASESPHARLLLHSDAPINFSATATGHVEYYVCHECGMQWERVRARSEPDSRWQASSKTLD